MSTGIKIKREESQLLEIFRGRILSLILPDGESCDEHLLRWIRAREGDLQKAEDMLRKHLLWRKAHGIGPSILDWGPPQSISSSYPVRLLGFDPSGSPIIFFTIGQWDFRKSIERGEKQSLLRYKDKILEQLMHLMRMAQDRAPFDTCVTQFIGIADWQGFSVRYVMNKDVVDVIVETAKSFEANYPETLKASFNINCPKVFSVVFNMIKPFLSEHTLSKIFIFDSNIVKWKSALGNMVPQELLPLKYRIDVDKPSVADNTLVELNLSDITPEEVDIELEKLLKTSVSIGKRERGNFENSILKIDIPKNEFINVKIAPGYRTNIPCKARGEKDGPLTPGTRISWDFTVEEKDINFGLFREAPIPDEIILGRKILGREHGSVICEKEGKYFLYFDNSHSMFKAKLINYALRVDNPFAIQ